MFDANLVKQLRNLCPCPSYSGCAAGEDCKLIAQAADEITRLQSVDVKRVEDICRLTQERDEARSALSVSQAQGEVLKSEMKGAVDELYSIFVDLGAPGTHAPGIANRLAVVQAKLTDALQSTPPTAVGRVIEAARKVNEATFSHVDGRDLLAELHPRKELDIKRRKDGVETWFEGDWLSNVYREIRPLREALAGLDGGRKG